MAGKAAPTCEILNPILDKYLHSLNSLDKPRKPGLNPSSMYGLCARIPILARVYPKPEAEMPLVPDSKNPNVIVVRPPVEPRLRRIFDVGTAIHRLAQNNYFAAAGILWGKWRCVRCGRETQVETTRPPQMCSCPLVAGQFITKGKTDKEIYIEQQQALLNWEYVEPHMVIMDSGLKISGYTDGILNIDNEKYILEAKSINSRGFTMDLKKGPKEEHVFQAQLYMSGFRVDKAIIWYINKDTQEPKEFLIRRDESYRNSAIRKALLYLDAQRGNLNTLPSRVCATPDDFRAKYKCGWAKECFDTFEIEKVSKMLSSGSIVIEKQDHVDGTEKLAEDHAVGEARPAAAEPKTTMPPKEVAAKETGIPAFDLDGDPSGSFGVDF